MFRLSLYSPLSLSLSFPLAHAHIFQKLHYAHFSIQKQRVVDEKFHLLSFDRSSTACCQIDAILSYIPVSI